MEAANERITILSWRRRRPAFLSKESLGNWIMFAYLDGALIGLLKPMRFCSSSILLSM